MMKNYGKTTLARRVFSFLMAVIMCVGMFAFTASADSGTSEEKQASETTEREEARESYEYGLLLYPVVELGEVEGFFLKDVKITVTYLPKNGEADPSEAETVEFDVGTIDYGKENPTAPFFYAKHGYLPGFPTDIKVSYTFDKDESMAKPVAAKQWRIGVSMLLPDVYTSDEYVPWDLEKYYYTYMEDDYKTFTPSNPTIDGWNSIVNGSTRLNQRLVSIYNNLNKNGAYSEEISCTKNSGYDPYFFLNNYQMPKISEIAVPTDGGETQVSFSVGQVIDSYGVLWHEQPIYTSSDERISIDENGIVTVGDEDNANKDYKVTFTVSIGSYIQTCEVNIKTFNYIFIFADQNGIYYYRTGRPPEPDFEKYIPYEIKYGEYVHFPFLPSQTSTGTYEYNGRWIWQQYEMVKNNRIYNEVTHGSMDGWHDSGTGIVYKSGDMLKCVSGPQVRYITTNYISEEHDYELLHTIPATCLDSRYSIYKCKICNYVKKVIDSEPLGHQLESKVINEPTCTEDGKKGLVCTRDGCSYAVPESIEDIPALGHSWDNGTITKKPSCNRVGEITYRCTAVNPYTHQPCGEERTEKLPALEHEDANSDGICDNCSNELSPYYTYHCRMCDAYYAKKDTPVLGNILYVIHYIYHFVEWITNAVK